MGSRVSYSLTSLWPISTFQWVYVASGPLAYSREGPQLVGHCSMDVGTCWSVLILSGLGSVIHWLLILLCFQLPDRPAIEGYTVGHLPFLPSLRGGVSPAPLASQSLL